MGHAHRWVTLGLVMSVALLAAGCGQELKKENVELKGQVTSLKADAEALKKQVEELDKEKQGLEEKLKEAEVKASAKPGTRPPLRSKKPS